MIPNVPENIKKPFIIFVQLMMLRTVSSTGFPAKSLGWLFLVFCSTGFWFEWCSECLFCMQNSTITRKYFVHLHAQSHLCIMDYSMMDLFKSVCRSTEEWLYLFALEVAVVPRAASSWLVTVLNSKKHREKLCCMKSPLVSPFQETAEGFWLKIVLLNVRYIGIDSAENVKYL